MAESYYELLGVPSDASTAEIERAYRERLKQTHPDVSDDADAGARTRRLIEAKEVLTDEDERDRYDRLGHDRYVGTDGDAADPATADPAEDPTPSTGPTAGTRASHDTGTTSRTGGSGREHGGAQSEAAGPGGNDGGPGPRSRRRRGRREHVGTPSWSGHREARAGEARAWNPDSPYAVRSNDPAGRLRTDRGVALLAVTLVSYPVLVGGMLFPGFPLAVNALIGVAALAVVAYVQSLPEVGIVAFGGWLLLGPVVLALVGVPVLSAYGAGVVVATLLPLGLSALTLVALR